MRHPDFRHSLKSGRKMADVQVLQGLYSRAIGFRTREIHEKEIVIKGKIKKIKEKIVTKDLAPDPTSIIFWLKNRDPANWRERHDEAVFSGPITQETKYQIIIVDTPKSPHETDEEYKNRPKELAEIRKLPQVKALMAQGGNDKGKERTK